MNLLNVMEIKTRPITRVWSPSLGFKLRVTAEHKRVLNRFRKLKNFRDKAGRPVRFFDPLAEDEIQCLRRYVAMLENLLPLWDSITINKANE